MDELPRLPRAIEPTRYRSQSFLDRELERVFPRSWLVVARESDVGGPMWLHSDLESTLAHFHDALDECLGADGGRGGLRRVR